MSKKPILPELLTFWIPFRPYRRTLHDILTMGIGNWRAVINSDKTKKFKYELAIGAIMKNEGPYIKEWLDFHILVGVKKFYLYDNDSTDNTLKIIQPYIDSGIVDYTPYPGRGVQRQAYIDMLARYKDDTRWLALIDLDEFLVPVKHRTVPAFLRTLPRFGQLVIGWVSYGSSGHIKKPKGLVIENYKRHAEISWGVKSIVNPRLVVKLTNPHMHRVAGFTIDESGTKRGRVNQEAAPTTHNWLRCNHYQTKSHDEYIARCNLGDAGSGEKVKVFRRDPETNFKLFDHNEVYDPIMDKWIKKLKAKK